MTRDTEDVVARVENAVQERLEWDGGQSDVSLQWGDARALLDERQSLSDRIDVLKGVVKRLGSSETMTFPFARRDNAEGQELLARIDYARAALHQEATAPDVGR